MFLARLEACPPHARVSRDCSQHATMPKKVANKPLWLQKFHNHKWNHKENAIKDPDVFCPLLWVCDPDTKRPIVDAKGVYVAQTCQGELCKDSAQPNRASVLHRPDAGNPSYVTQASAAALWTVQRGSSAWADQACDTALPRGPCAHSASYLPRCLLLAPAHVSAALL